MGALVRYEETVMLSWIRNKWPGMKRISYQRGIFIKTW